MLPSAFAGHPIKRRPLSVLRKPFASNRNEPVVVSIISGDSEFALNSVAVVTGKKPRPRTAKSVEFDVLINAPSSLIKRCELARTPPMTPLIKPMN